eukprot:2875079-Rhodomonas_salina.1
MHLISPSTCNPPPPPPGNPPNPQNPRAGSRRLLEVYGCGVSEKWGFVVLAPAVPNTATIRQLSTGHCIANAERYRSVPSQIGTQRAAVPYPLRNQPFSPHWYRHTPMSVSGIAQHARRPIAQHSQSVPSIT